MSTVASEMPGVGTRRGFPSSGPVRGALLSCRPPVGAPRADDGEVLMAAQLRGVQRGH